MSEENLLNDQISILVLSSGWNFSSGISVPELLKIFRKFRNNNKVRRVALPIFF